MQRLSSFLRVVRFQVLPVAPDGGVVAGDAVAASGFVVVEFEHNYVVSLVEVELVKGQDTLCYHFSLGSNLHSVSNDLKFHFLW